MLGAALAVVPWRLHARDVRTEHESTAVMAAVAQHETTTDADGSAEHRVSYVFTLPDGTTSEGRAVVTQEGSESLALGDSIRIAYDPARPSNSYPLDNGRGIDGGFHSVGVAATFSTLGALMAGVGGLYLWGLLVRLPGVWHRLLQDGRETEGRLVEIEHSEDASKARLYYAYRDRRGAEHAGATGWVARAVSDEWEPGDPGVVRYAREDAAESVWLGRGTLAFYR